jgi:hypothetical protein
MNDAKMIRQYSRDALVSELDFRRERRHRVFLWCSSIFVTAIGGNAALNHEGHSLAWSHKVIITSTIITLLLFTCGWIIHHRQVEKRVHDKICEIEVLLRMLTVEVKIPRLGMQTFAIFLLAVLAFLAVWASEICNSSVLTQFCTMENQKLPNQNSHLSGTR